MFNEDGTVTLWHGTPIENLESILKRGIVPNPNSKNAEKRVEEAFRLVEEKLGIKLSNKRKSVRFVKESSIQRLLEAKRKGNIVFVSAQKNYAICNSLASKEWLMMIVELGIRQKYSEYFEKLRRIAHRKNVLEDKISKLTIKCAKAKDLATYRKLSEEISRLEKERLSLEFITEKDSELKKITREIKEIRQQFLGDKAVIFEIRIPKESLYSLLADSFSREEVERYEKESKEDDSEYLKPLELHLKYVKPEYIVSYEVIEKRGEFPIEEHTVLTKVVLNH